MLLSSFSGWISAGRLYPNDDQLQAHVGYRRSERSELLISGDAAKRLSEFSLGFQPRDNFLSRDRMLADPDATGIVDCIGDGARRGTDRSFRESFAPEEPARFQAIDEYLSRVGNVHDCGKPIRQKADGVVTGPRKLTIR